LIILICLNVRHFKVQELKSSLLEVQSEFQIQVKALKTELEEEKQARLKLESEVKSLQKLVNKLN